MVRRVAVVFVLLFLVGTAAMPQEPDARAVVRAASAAIGADTLKCITYLANGSIGLVGQNYRPSDDWARVEIADYARTINFDAQSSREEQVRRQGNFPRRGGGGIPIVGEQRLISLVSGDHAWNQQGNVVTPAPALSELRQLDIWLTPHGFLKGAIQASTVTAFFRLEAGIPMTVVSYVWRKYRLTASINRDNVVERVQTFIATPFMGDTMVEHRYLDYKDFGGVRFPTTFDYHTNWDQEVSPWNPNGGHNAMALSVRSVQSNACGEPLVVPDTVRQARLPPVRVESEKLADGVYYLTGGSHHSVALEFRDFVAVVEAPLHEERSLAVIDSVKRLFPKKPLQYLVNTHHHFDHAGGLRTYVHQGVRVVTHRENAELYYKEVLSVAPRTLAPDRLSLYPLSSPNSPYHFDVVNEQYALTDGVRVVNLHAIPANPHALGMLVVHLPGERILIEADLFTPPPADVPLPSSPSEANLRLYEAVQQLSLQVDRIVPLHGRVYPWGDFVKFVDRGSVSK